MSAPEVLASGWGVDRPDRYREGYKAAARYYANQHTVAANVAREWVKPEAEKVRGLIRKHWPALAEQIDRLEAD